MSALRMRLVDKAEGIIRESVKPLERIEGIKILQVDGLGGGQSGGSGGDGGSANFADGVVNSALRFRAQAPLVDQLLREIGIEGGGGDLQRMVVSTSGAQAALPPIPESRVAIPIFVMRLLTAPRSPARPSLWVRKVEPEAMVPLSSLLLAEQPRAVLRIRTAL